jgi:hypothetical protein
VEGVLGTSESGQVVYFSSTTALTSVAGPGGKLPVPEEANIYRWQEKANPAITFVATVKNGGLFGGGLSSYEGDARDWSPADVDPGNQGTVTTRTARVSADGGVVVFSSHHSLTGMPNRAPGCNVSSSQVAVPCAEFFRYDAADKSLDCVSCSPLGIQPINNATIGTGYINAADLPIVFAMPVLTRNLSANGNRFFFQTPDSLATNDENGPGCAPSPTEGEGCMDVYEWEAEGEGACRSSTEGGGCIYLISGGKGDEPSYFADADETGENVFFFSGSKLVPQDRDQLYDIYDARVNGGLASQDPVATVPCASRQSCQGSQSASPAPSSAGTSSFVGPENPKPPASCKKGFVSKHGKCVKKSKAKKHAKHKKKGKRHKKKGRGASKKHRTGKDKGGRK